MSIGVIATVFALVAVAELPDKTMIATLVMGSRGRPGWVWLGCAGAFLVHVILAVVAGRLLELLPHRVLEIVVTVLFFGGAVYLLVVTEKGEEEKGKEAAAAEDEVRPWKIAGAAFGVILVGEFGDLTQLLTVNLTAKYHQPISVFIGALLALWGVAALGAFGGKALLRVIPVGVIRRIGGVVLLGFAAYNIYALVR
ncbi:MAG TPA: TMEM165/GDT1 family protein [Acidimicrobiales bacterium]|nr:TMEM165/GDT1 family protein [Acidimicrobiales bacterium]